MKTGLGLALMEGGDGGRCIGLLMLGTGPRLYFGDLSE